MINEMKNSRSSDLLPMFYDCKYLILKKKEKKKKKKKKKSYISRHNLTQAESIHYDYSTKVATLKSKLLVLVFETQLAGDCSSWQTINHTFI